MRLEKKDILLIVPATLLALAGLGPDDLWTIVPCLLGSWFCFIWLCIAHSGRKKWRIATGIGITLVLASFGARRLSTVIHLEKAHLTEPGPDSAKIDIDWIRLLPPAAPGNPFAVAVNFSNRGQLPAKEYTHSFSLSVSGGPMPESYVNSAMDAVRAGAKDATPTNNDLQPGTPRQSTIQSDQRGALFEEGATWARNYADPMLITKDLNNIVAGNKRLYLFVVFRYI